MKIRYFIVFYMGNGVPSGITHGHCVIKTRGGYVNADKTLEDIQGSDNSITSPVLTNIIELSESDFNDFIKSKSTQADGTDTK